jgi:putative transposase
MAKAVAKGKKPKKIMRVDRLAQHANAGKHKLLVELLHAWRNTASELAVEQWRLFYETGRFNSKHVRLNPHSLLGGARVQMARFQVAGILKGYTGSLADKFKQCVNNSSLSAEQKHKLHRINRASAWYWTEPPEFKKPPQVDSNDMLLARQIFRHLLKHNRKPNMQRINAVLDKRTVRVEQADESSHFHYWLNVATLVKKGRGYKRVAVPLRSHAFAEARPGERSTTWQLNINRDGQIHVGRLTDVSGPYAQQKAAYQIRTPELALDFGLRNLLATSDGDLLGRNFLDKLVAYDKVITGIARHLQRSGKKPRESARYRAKVHALRSYLTSEINRCFNWLIEIRAPGHLILERLDFRCSQLSRRLNRIISNAGRSILKQKLAELEQRLGITSEEGNAAYSSQECANEACGYVDKRNRRGEVFKCLACGFTRHADAKAAVVMKRRCSSPNYRLPFGKLKALNVLVRRYIERFPEPRPGIRRSRDQGIPADPRLSNAYFKAWSSAARLNHGSAVALSNLSQSDNPQLAVKGHGFVLDRRLTYSNWAKIGWSVRLRRSISMASKAEILRMNCLPLSGSSRTWLYTPIGVARANATVPTGLSSLPPSGPAIPDVARANSQLAER